MKISSSAAKPSLNDDLGPRRPLRRATSPPSAPARSSDVATCTHPSCHLGDVSMSRAARTSPRCGPSRSRCRPRRRRGSGRRPRQRGRVGEVVREALVPARRPPPAAAASGAGLLHRGEASSTFVRDAVHHVPEVSPGGLSVRGICRSAGRRSFRNVLEHQRPAARRASARCPCTRARELRDADVADQRPTPPSRGDRCSTRDIHELPRPWPAARRPRSTGLRSTARVRPSSSSRPLCLRKSSSTEFSQRIAWRIRMGRCASTSRPAICATISL